MSDREQFAANPEFILREIAGEAILVPVGTVAERFSGLAALNESGAFLWRALSRRQTPEELAAALAEEYDLPPDRARADVAEFLAAAMTRGAVLQG